MLAQAIPTTTRFLVRDEGRVAYDVTGQRPTGRPRARPSAISASSTAPPRPRMWPPPTSPWCPWTCAAWANPAPGGRLLGHRHRLGHAGPGQGAGRRTGRPGGQLPSARGLRRLGRRRGARARGQPDVDRPLRARHPAPLAAAAAPRLGHDQRRSGASVGRRACGAPTTPACTRPAKPARPGRVSSQRPRSAISASPAASRPLRAMLRAVPKPDVEARLAPVRSTPTLVVDGVHTTWTSPWSMVNPLAEARLVADRLQRQRAHGRRRLATTRTPRSPAQVAPADRPAFSTQAAGLRGRSAASRGLDRAAVVRRRRRDWPTPKAWSS